jgi:hypothetical protein
MNIGVDAREIQNGVITGIGRSLENFIQYFNNNDLEHKLVLFSEKELPLYLNGNNKKIVLPECPRFIWDQWKLPKAMSSHNIDLFYSPYYKIPLISSIPIISQILDLMFLQHPPYKDKLMLCQKLYYEIFGKAFARKSLSIITDSKHAKNDIVNLWNVDPEKIVVIPIGLGDFYEPVSDKKLLDKIRKNFKLPEKFILYLGNFKPHKNVTSLVKAFKIIEKKFSEYKLVLAGTLDEHGIKIKDYVTRQGLETKIIFTNTVTERDHPEAILSMADLFVFPTLYEGFGLPPLEAMACGTPVVASNLTSVPEVVDDAGILVNPLDIREFSNAISDLLENPEKREQYSKKGLKRAERFKKKDTAGKLYEHIISKLQEIK